MTANVKTGHSAIASSARRNFNGRRGVVRLIMFGALLLTTCIAAAGEQRYEPMAASVRSALAIAIDAGEVPSPYFDSPAVRDEWLAQMSARLPRRWKPTQAEREEFLLTVRYEAQRAGLDPALVLAVIHVESYFRRYAISSADARGYMQVMPFWAKLIGDGDESRLFDMRTNLRYGCTILRYYIDREKGNLFRALGRYNGSLGRAKYPKKVLKAWRKWSFKPAARPLMAAVE